MPRIPKDQRSPYDRMMDDVPRRRRRRQANTAHRQQDRGDSDDDDNDGDDNELIWRFRDLKRKKIVGNWTTLLAWIANEGFPPGIMLGQNSRGWLAGDVMAWLKSRPAAGGAKQRDHAMTP